VDDMLVLSAPLPEVDVAPGEVLVAEGEATGCIWVLVSGALAVTRGDVPVNTITRAGSVIGEVSILLGSAKASATVTASEPSRLRKATDGSSFLRSNPEILHLVAVDLAERLNFVTRYLADLKVQYGDAPGLAMVPAVLRRLAERKGPVAVRGSARDPDPEY
jgi:CRP-like cAMP-binding protein